MKTLLSIGLFSLVAPLLHAEDCVKFEEKAEQKEVQIIPRWGMKVIVPTRVYFHSAPSNTCKIKDLFMIKNDHITAYSTYDDGQEQWVSVMYFSKRLGDTVQGWAKLKDFEYTGTMSGFN
ncbi:hypothetical protein [Acinetobacter sp. SWAC57]|uniref:hypothetical protein n=1 Tax=Acinetobacter sp. SWAC57 TaxID=2293834 RepID=UPI00148E3CC6|nr:hypothetical protein [Acinetobacter sp. SWAC57]